ncbi:MAG: endonuclease/exonuclease/phosphatase family protein [Dermatophilaceae bacterium]|nr:endonuclease/exonuclease/phosphatase family protein [Intrasporangiaceae bacterium]
MSHPTETGSGGGTRLRIASYNTRDFRDDRHAAARVVRRVDPDILCLQEVPRRLFSGLRVRRFAAECGLSWPGGHRGSGGTTILTGSRVAVEVAWHHRLSVALHMRTRGYALARLVVNGLPIVVASVHLSLVAGERRAHTVQILRGVTTAADGAGRTIIAGDLNELDSGSAWGLIDSRLRLVSPTAPTFPTRRPRTLLDVIFASADVTVLPHAEVDLGEDDVRAASDHRPVWADVLV